jgi:uncharacterized LabA/DUF88 family protein
MTKSGNRVFVFIDASNLWAVQKSKGQLLDFQKLNSYLKNNFSSNIKVFYYDAYPKEGTRPYSVSGKFKQYTFLEKGLGFTVRKKPLKQIHRLIDKIDTVFEKGNMDVEMTIDAVHFVNKYDTMIIFSGDSDFLAIINFVKSRGKKVFVFSSKNNISKELVSASNKYYDILTIEEDIWRNQLNHRPKR